jgi:hypothetical protein
MKVLLHSAPPVFHQRNERFVLQDVPGAVIVGRLERLSLVQQVVQSAVAAGNFTTLIFSEHKNHP